MPSKHRKTKVGHIIGWAEQYPKTFAISNEIRMVDAYDDDALKKGKRGKTAGERIPNIFSKTGMAPDYDYFK